jgi:hypothetical protein
MKTFFIIPGFKMRAQDKEFDWLIIFLKTKGFKVFLVPIVWNYKTLSQNAKEFIDFFNNNKSEENYVLGFSFGAVISFITANILKPKKIFLCSLSPNFKEDKIFINKNSRKYIGKRRFSDIDNRSAVKFSKELKVQAVLFYGEREGVVYPHLRKRSEETLRFSKKSKLIIVKNSPHNINFPEYINAIKKELVNV